MITSQGGGKFLKFCGIFQTVTESVAAQTTIKDRYSYP